MKVNIKKWGNSYAVRIPKVIIDDANLEADSEVEVYLAEGKIILSPAPNKKMTLQSLVDKITEENVHHEVDTGPSLGNEVD